tara:strand:- start:248 stop:571 length:324 start_codon:yes stop_codon:yes gene_type:complete
MQEQINSIESDLKEVKNALLGNEFNKNGLVSRVEKIESYQSKDKKHKWMVAGGFVVITFLSKFIHKLFLFAIVTTFLSCSQTQRIEPNYNIDLSDTLVFHTNKLDTL